ncbi:MAG TPA: hypothetical protein VK717_08245 [Opitutaceae bacterium]|nr:hypothetical protein [Opitutaceae bacterium]
MLFLAANTLDKIKQVPLDVWLKVGLGILAFIVLVFVLRWIAGVNKVLLGIGGFMFCALLIFSWIYHRNEPAFLTPLVDKIAPFFPAAGSYGATQQQEPGEKSPPKKPAPPPSHVY